MFRVKKIILIMIVLTLCVSYTGCTGKKNNGASSNTQSTNTSTEGNGNTDLNSNIDSSSNYITSSQSQSIPKSSQNISNSSSKTSQNSNPPTLPANDIAFMSVFSDNMVIQRDKPIKIWGTYNGPNENVLINVEFGGAKKIAFAKDGKWEADFPAQGANSSPQSITIASGGKTKTIQGALIGDVWLCSGQSNMAYTVNELPSLIPSYQSMTTNKNIRVFNVPRIYNIYATDPLQPEFLKGDLPSKNKYWSVPSNSEVSDYSCYAYAFANRLYKDINVPIGIIVSAVGNTTIQCWLPQEAYAPLGLGAAIGAYNSMIYPLKGLNIKGILWYQGESNVMKLRSWDPSVYTKLFKEYSTRYRALFNDSKLPIITTQLPKYLDPNLTVSTFRFWHLIRLTQWEIAQADSYNHMVCGIDMGEPVTELHPQDKIPFATRAAELALNKVYNKNTLGESPYPSNYTVSGEKVILTFGNAESGLEFRNGALKELYILKSDGTKVLATGTITGTNTIEVTAAGVTPKGIEYAVSYAPSVNFYAKNGLPVVPFKLTF